MVPKRQVIIVDGVTNSGKTTAMSILRKQMPGCTRIKFSDYYQKSIQRLLGEINPQVDYASLDKRIVRQAIGSNMARYGGLLHTVRDTSVDDYLIERLHPTDYVYQKQLFGALGSFEPLEEALNELEAHMVVLTLDDTVLRHRMEETLGRRNRRHGASFEVPEHILSYDSNRQKRDLYLEFFEQSAVAKKVLIDTSYFTEEEFRKAL
ncbi:hypothetical protein HYS49_00685, partial [Candidatus Woesearchaeota archaeon]|nr:hypothetical protein [Candidatus Woesearchaeota archaeon]